MAEKLEIFMLPETGTSVFNIVLTLFLDSRPLFIFLPIIFVWSARHQVRNRSIPLLMSLFNFNVAYS